jgi:hypothetical protein
MVDQLGIARAAVNTAFYWGTDEQKGRFATRLSVSQHFGGHDRTPTIRIAACEYNVQRLRMPCLTLQDHSAQGQES